jgi:FMN phosphatase YigB (HAD superfamily)
MMESKSIKVVSFDIFDTLIQRPFLFATDPFSLMDKDFVEITGALNWLPFAELRQLAEDECRRVKNVLRPSNEDITLDEIYQWMSEHYFVSAEQVQRIKQKEIEYEIRFAEPRAVGKELYDYAVSLNKRVVLITDMYLPKDAIAAILEKCGYAGYAGLYISNEYGLCKGTGRLFKAALKNEGIKSENWLHIGDNIGADYHAPRGVKINVYHLPKAADLFMGEYPNSYTGYSYSKIFSPGIGMHDMQRGARDSFAGIRAMLGMAANRIFGEFYSDFTSATDVNISPEYFGYYALGMYGYAVADWLMEKTKGGHVGTIHFAARDGYLFKQVYDILAKCKPNAPNSNYLYCSRKSLLFADIKSKADLLSLSRKMNCKMHSPASLFRLFSPIIPVDKAPGFEQWLTHYGYKRSETAFVHIGEFNRFIKAFAGEFLDEGLLSEANRAAGAYFNEQINEGDVLFDVGYSGRVESAVTALLGFPFHSYYVHSNSSQVYDRARTLGFKCETLYPYKPIVTGHLREHCTSELAPGCVGYSIVDGKGVPVFEEYVPDPDAEVNTRTAQNAAVQFAKDFTDTFGDMLDRLPFRQFDACMPFEYFLHYSNAEDLMMFEKVAFEDDFGTGDMNLVDITLKERIQMGNLEDRRNVEQLEEQIRVMRNSWTWRVGRVFVGLPGYIKRKVRG